MKPGFGFAFFVSICLKDIWRFTKVFVSAYWHVEGWVVEWVSFGGNRPIAGWGCGLVGSNIGYPDFVWECQRLVVQPIWVGTFEG